MANKCNCGNWFGVGQHAVACPKASDAKPLSETLSAHDHGNCELCDALDTERDAQAAKIAELEAEFLATKDADNKFLMELRTQHKALLTRAVEAMKRVPHVPLGSHVIGSWNDTPVVLQACARLGGACAFKALIEEIERNG